MLQKDEIIRTAIDTIIAEAKAVEKIAGKIGDDFARVVELIYVCKGRVIVTGIGKSAIIAGKIVATLNSTGTPAIFMHAADAIHGDLGIIQNDDIVICLSKSGNTPEIKLLVPLIRNLGNILVAIVGNTASYLAGNADYVIQATVDKEACPNNLAPTSSTTVQMVIGDAIAVCLIRCRGFSLEDFAKVHPGGAIGKQLYMRVSDIYAVNEVPKVLPLAGIREVILEMTAKRLGATAVTDDENNLLGIITDGDLRRMLQNNPRIENLTAAEVMTSSPKTINKNELAVNAFNIMENNKITQLVVVDGKKYMGIIHLHDILREGIM
ncbi:MAG: KpsF/GutQ family sugar-phosphate isomerase [Bacteroidia bacterium]|nr:KpsF/GutQ family sugar-phosphate isomerase [Bacteroidia bacterium]